MGLFGVLIVFYNHATLWIKHTGLMLSLCKINTLLLVYSSLNMVFTVSLCLYQLVLDSPFVLIEASNSDNILINCGC